MMLPGFSKSKAITTTILTKQEKAAVTATSEGTEILGTSKKSCGV